MSHKLSKEDLEQIKYINLKNKTSYSLMTAIGVVKDHLETCRNKGHAGLCITDNGVMMASLDQYNVCKNEKYPSVLGNSLSIVSNTELKNLLIKPNNIGIYVKNFKGYQNAAYLTSIGTVDEKFYKTARIDFFDLFDNKEGIMVTCGGFTGIISQAILQKRGLAKKYLIKNLDNNELIDFINSIKDYSIDLISEIINKSKIDENNIKPMRLLLNNPIFFEAIKEILNKKEYHSILNEKFPISKKSISIINKEDIEDNVYFTIVNILNEFSPDDIIERFKKEFKDDFYLELSFLPKDRVWDKDEKIHIDLDEDPNEEIIKEYIELSKKHKVKIVATQESYMKNEEDHILQSIMLWNRPGSKDGFYFPIAQYIMSLDEMYNLMKDNYSFVTDELFLDWTTTTNEFIEKSKDLVLKFKPSLPKLDYEEHYVNKVPVVIQSELMKALQEEEVWSEELKARIKKNKSIQNESIISDKTKEKFKNEEDCINFEEMKEREKENIFLEKVLVDMEKFYKDKDEPFVKLLKKSRKDLSLRTSLKVIIRNKKLVPKLIDEEKIQAIIDKNPKTKGKTIKDFPEELIDRLAEKNSFFIETVDPMLLLGNEVVRDRLVLELNTIQYNGILRLITYFMLLEDVSNFINENPNAEKGLGRGSGAGSIVAHGLDITDCDPLKYNLLFERFLTKERIGEVFTDIELFSLSEFMSMIEEGSFKKFCKSLGFKELKLDFDEVKSFLSTDEEILIDNINKLIIKERDTEDLKQWKEDELFFMECNPENLAYYIFMQKAIVDKVKNINNSTIAYLIGITDEKPTDSINATPTTLPDIDYDTNARDEIKEYLVYKFGREYVTLMGTFGTLKTKGAIKDVLRQLRPDMSFKDVNILTKNFEKIKETDYKTDLDYFYAGLTEVKELKEFFEQNPDIKETVEAILGNIRSTGIHAGGIVVAGDDVTRVVPCLFERKKEKMWVTQPDMKYVEWAGLIKYDFLGLNTLNDTNRAYRLIEKRHGKKISDKTIPLNDPVVMRRFRKGDTMTVFQFGSALFKKLLVQLKEINNVNDLAIITSINRPGPLEMGMDSEFIKRVNKEEPITYFHPSLEPILKDTYGITCLVGDSNILTKEGIKKIKNVKAGDFVKTENGSWQKVLKNLKQGKKKTIKIRVDNGEELICTPDHKILTADGWKEAQHLTKKDLIKAFWMANENKEIGTDEDWLIGLSLADGDNCDSTPRIACNSKEFADKVSYLANDIYNMEAYSDFKLRCWYSVLRQKSGNNGFFNTSYTPNKFIKRLKELNLYKKNCFQKRFPKNPSLQMLAGFIEGDGSLFNNRVRLKNKKLAYDLFLGLQSYRIPSSFFEDNDNVFTVSFTDYEKKLPFKIKQRKILNTIGPYIPRKFVQNEIKKQFSTVRENRRLSQKVSPKIMKNRPFIQKSILNEINIDSKNIHLNWGKVISIRENNIEEVFDLSVENIHSFTSGGLVVHNCYQEQVMSIVRQIGGLTGNESVVVLKAMGKKQLDKLVKFKKKFLEEASKKYPEMSDIVDFEDPETKEIIKVSLAEKIWRYLEAFAKYGFNKSHAIAYSTVSYFCMWLKHYYEIEWITAVLSGSNKDDFKEFYAEWHDKILKPDINKSKKDYVIETVNGLDKTIMPFSFINGVGSKAVESIVSCQPFTSFEDFFTRVDKRRVNKTSIINLIMSGTFDPLMKEIIQDKKDKNPDLTEEELSRLDNVSIAGFRKMLVRDFFNLKRKQKKPSKKEQLEIDDFLDELNDMNRGQFLMKEVSLLNLTAFNYYEFYKDHMTRGAMNKFGKEAITPKQALKAKDRSEVVVGGAIESIKIFPIKNGKNKGKEMAKLTLINEDSKISVTVFSNKLETDSSGRNLIRDLEEFTPVIIKGTISKDEKWGTSIFFNKGWDLSQ